VEGGVGRKGWPLARSLATQLSHAKLPPFLYRAFYVSSADEARQLLFAFDNKSYGAS
jgi:hypothetical protein